MDIRALLKAIVWCLLSLFFGLLQLWFVIGYSALDQTLTVDTNQIILDCGVVFFCTALVAGLALDFFAHNKKKWTELGLIGFAYAFYPALVAIIATLVYSVCYRGNPDVTLIRNLQLVLISMSLLYAAGVKHYAFQK